MSENELIKELNIMYNDNKSLFDLNDSYIIPLYQRSYAWEEREIVQLIHDIYYMDENSDNYYLGSLIVAKKENKKYEVIDGQQRLTTLFIILKCLFKLGFITNDIDNTLQFFYREKSNYTLKEINNLIKDEWIEVSIKDGRDIVIDELKRLCKEDEDEKKGFIKKLKKVVLYRIEVPKNTDLNRYFEIMNTRGEQLEQHDILKATLMSNLPEEERDAFAVIWDACSDMTGYVQMHFDTKNREVLFGSRWNNEPKEEDIVKKFLKNGTHKVEELSNKIADFIKGDYKDEGYELNENNERVRFESIINFSFFLLHVLKVYAETHNLLNRAELIDELLDDKKLTKSFERVIENGVSDKGKISEYKGDFARGFIICLLQCRFAFDKYIIKREYVNEDSDGKWSLKELNTSGQKTQKKAYFKNTDFRKTSEWEATGEVRSKRILMLQSCFRVSYTSPKVMHWITELLTWLMEKQKIYLFETINENIAKRAIIKDFIKPCNESEINKYDLGVDTPHIVFNYLDYLLWNENKSYEDFDFEFRNSVEHWYPQHPSEGMFEKWLPKEGLNSFGNLCIIQRGINSKFSNLAPSAKKTSFKETIAKGSLKLRIMEKETTGDKEWKNETYLHHEHSMIKKLLLACKDQDESLIVPLLEDLEKKMN